MKSNYRIGAISITLFLILVGAACVNTPAPTQSGDSQKGSALVIQQILGEGPGCTTCHLFDDGPIKVGPSLVGVAIRAQTRVENLSAEEYINQSILEPNAYVVVGFPSSVMYQKYSEQISDEELANIVAYLMTLE